MGFGQDPNTGEQLERLYPKFTTTAERVERRFTCIPVNLTPEEAAAQSALVEVEETAKSTSAPLRDSI